MYCISLPDDSRRLQFEQRAVAMGQRFQWWEAIDGRSKARSELEAMTDRPVVWGAPNAHDTLQRPGELALILSSIALWQHARERGFDHLVVMEDDAMMLAPFSIEIPADADLVFFNDRSMRNAKGQTSGYVCGTDGYLATRTGIAKLLRVFSSIYMPLDLQMIAQMPQMADCGHHLSQRFNKDAPALVSYTVGPLVAHGRFSSLIR